ncbi:MAG TPA: outer membrane beta-barrel protein [Candidatus Binatia bacterium]|nr:outer membrane beta-barrel protein [Candidatus Binatia bacterium]
MVRKLAVLIAILVVGSLVAAAQESTSKFDVFGGYSYFNGDTNSSLGRFSLNGWNAQGTLNFNKWLGLTADFGGYYGSPFHVSTSDYSFLFGPTVTVRSPHFSPYVHALFGVDRLNASGFGASGNDSSFAMAFGGGIDLPLSSRFSIRAGQFDWLRTSHFSTGQNNLRVSTGVVFRFGE